MVQPNERLSRAMQDDLCGVRFKRWFPLQTTKCQLPYDMMFVAHEAGVNPTTSAITRSSEIAGVFEIARIVWSQKRTALATFFALISVVFVAFSVITPTYEASTLVVVGQNALDGSPEALSTTEISTTLAQIVESEEVIRQAVEKVGLTKLVGPTNDPLTLRDAPGIRD